MPKQSTPPPLTGQIAELPLPPLKKAEDYLGAYKGVAYAAISTIAEDFASIGLRLYKRKFVRGKMELEEIDEHEALSLLDHVNEFATGYDLKEATEIYLKTTGEAFWLLLRDVGNKPVEIWPLRPDWISIKPDARKVIKGYTYRPPGLSEEIFFDAQDVIHFKAFNPKNLQRGYGGVQAAAMDIDLDDFTASYTRNFFFNSAVPSLLLKTKTNLTEQQIKRFMSQWHSSFGGVRQSHKMGILTGDWEVDQLSDKSEKTNTIEHRKYARDQILAVFGVPKSVLGITEDVNRANAEATIAAYMERTIKPEMERFVQQLNEFYLRNWPDEDIFFWYDDPVPADRKLQLEVYQNGLTNGWLTINEVREEENRPPVEGGDVIYVPGGKGPLGADPANPDNESAKGYLQLKVKKSKNDKFKHIKIPQRRLKEIRKEAIKKEWRPKIIKMLSNAIKISQDEAKRDGHWKTFVAKTDTWEDIFKEKVVMLFNEQQSIVNVNVENKNVQGKKKSVDEIARLLFSLASENKKWMAVLEPVIRQIIKEQGRDVLDFLGLNGDIDDTQERVLDYINTTAGEFIKGINDVTLKRLRETLSEGVKNGEGVDDLKSRVEEVFDASKGVRAEIIARTEVLRASNFATVESYKQSGVVKGKEWLTALDERVDENICKPMDGQVVPLDKEFKDGEGFPIDYPPAHPGCRCTTIPVII